MILKKKTSTSIFWAAWLYREVRSHSKSWVLVKFLRCYVSHVKRVQSLTQSSQFRLNHWWEILTTERLTTNIVSTTSQVYNSSVANRCQNNCEKIWYKVRNEGLYKMAFHQWQVDMFQISSCGLVEDKGFWCKTFCILLVLSCHLNSAEAFHMIMSLTQCIPIALLLKLEKDWGPILTRTVPHLSQFSVYMRHRISRWVTVTQSCRFISSQSVILWYQLLNLPPQIRGLSFTLSQ